MLANELQALFLEINELAALSNLGMEENPLNKLTEIFMKSAKGMALLTTADNSELEAMDVDLEEIRAGALVEPISYYKGVDLLEIENEAIGEEFSTQPYLY